VREQIKGITAAGLGGTAVGLVLGMVTLPLIAVSAGALTAFFVTRTFGVQRHYDSVGTVFFLSLGTLVYLIPFLPTAFKQTPQLFLVVFGLISAAIVVVKRGVSHVLSYVASTLGRGDSASSIWNAVSSIVGALILVWSIIKMKQRLTKTAVTGAATPLGLVLNVAGHFTELPWVFEVGVDITAMVFIGGVMVGFHTLTSWYEVLALRQDPFVQAVAKKSKDTATTAASKTREKASKADPIGGGVMSQVLGVTPASTAGPSRPSPDEDDVPDPDEDVAHTVDTQPSDGAGEFVDGTDHEPSAAEDPPRTGTETNSEGTPGPDSLATPAARLGLPAQPEPVSEGIETMTAAVDAVIDETDAVADGVVDRGADPVERASSVQRAADGGTLLTAETTAAESDDRRSEPTTGVPPELSGAVRTVRTQVSPRATEAQELLDALQLSGDVSERHLTNTVSGVLEKLNTHAELAAALAEVDPTDEPRHLARQLDRHGSDIDGPAGSGLATVAAELDEAIRELEQCRTERQRLAGNAEAVCAAANDQTTIRFESSASTDEWLDALTDSVTDGSVSFTDQANDIGSLVSTAETEVRPQSSLARSVVEALRSDSMDADERERTIADALEAIDSTETLRHRLADVSADDVETLARRLEGDLDGINTAGSAQLAERVAELRGTVSQADAADRLTVYAARQELRFYDQQLLDALQQTPDRAGTGGPVADRYQDVDRRRSRMRTDYPDNYPNHDHSIPIHFLELVEALQESAEQARTSGNEERAIGYLLAADRTLDWVAELYDRQAYSALLEQLRG
jgi:hypothetical protein